MAIEVATGKRGSAPRSVTFLSGDVHHSYVSRVVDLPAGAQILQAVCSPIRNPLPRVFRFATAASSYPIAGVMGLAVSRSAKVPEPPFTWERVKGPWFDNNLATLEVLDDGLEMWWATGHRPRRAARPAPPGAGLDRPGPQGRDHADGLRSSGLRTHTRQSVGKVEHMTSQNTVPTIPLHDGTTIPQLGFGVFQVPPEETAEAVTKAFEVGYRHIDTAEMYENEAGVGEAIKASGIPRDELYVTSKLNNGFHEPDDARRAFDETMSKLGLDQLDLFLIHWPLPTLYDGDFVSTWKVLTELVADGRLRSAGVSNFEPGAPASASSTRPASCRW